MMNKKLQIISKYNDEDLQKYFDREKLTDLHAMKLYLDNAYYNVGEDTGIKDYQYDMLKETLQRRDPDYVVPVGAKIREGENRVKLPFWLGSMDKFKPEDKSEIAKWLLKNKSSEYIVEDKLDGISCLVIIKKGKIKLYTRGDGVVGADISYLSQYFDTIPKNLDVDINVRGELIMPIETFNKKYADEYANPRNMVAGRVGAKKVRVGLKDIKFIAYEIVGDGMMDKPSKQVEYMKSLGFTTVRYELIKNFNVDTLIEMFLRFKINNKFEIDGIIIQADKSYERNVDGNPEYAFAFKMRQEENIVEAKVVDVIWNISKWGQLKPRVEISPVQLGGVKITYTTGFNGKYIYDNSIGEGAIIKITRSGDVIPYIVEVVKKAKEPSMPDIPWRWNETNVDIIAEDFGETMCIKLMHSFFEKLGIKHLGEKSIEKMYNDGLDTLLKLISASKQRIAQVEGFGDKGAERIYDNIRKGMKDLYIPTVLGASGIFGFGMGRKRINNLFDEYPTILEESKKISKKEMYNKIMKIEGFSEKTTESIVENINWANKFIIALSKFATFKGKTIINDNMKGLKVIFSGFRDAKLGDAVVSRGGKIVTSISKNTNILVVASKTGKETDKIKKAREFGVEILEKEEFINKYIANN
jgi:DNA ligase (NAD+)